MGLVRARLTQVQAGPLLAGVGALVVKARPVLAHVQLLPGVLSAVMVLGLLELGVGLTPLGWSVGVAFDTTVLLLLGRSLARSGAEGRQLANQITLVRAMLVGGVAALVAGSLTRPVDVAVLVGTSTLALVLDAVDGQVARRTHTVSAVGARFDMEVDAFLILVLSVYVGRSLGSWVVVIGLARYLYLVAGVVWPWLREPAPPRLWAKVVAATQGVVLTTVVAGVLPRAAATAVTVAALILLAESFGRDVVRLAARRAGRPHPVEKAQSPVTAGRTSGGWRARAPVAPALTVAAAVMVWLALTLPNRLDQLTPGAFVQIPVEGLVLLAAGLVLPPRPRQVLAAVVGGVLGALVLLKILDMGYYSQLNRPFNPVLEWGSLGPAFGVLRDSVGSARAYVAVGGAVLLAVAIVTAAVWASLRVIRRSAAHRRGSARIVAALGIAWMGIAAVGLDIVPQTPVASRATMTFVADEVRSVAAAARDRTQFAAQLAATDPYSATPSAELLTSLRGKDVIVAFVESYGRVAVEGSTFAPGIRSVLADGTQALDAAGFASRSGFLTSPTFGGVSWLAHATLQSGLWVDDRQAYGQLLASDRLTLSAAFKAAGWRTVNDAPANTRPWPEGKDFYRYDRLYDATNTGYRGPRFSYATMPDQYTLEAFRRLELTPGHRPVMAEIDLVSSHIPWAPLPAVVDWADVGDGSVYDAMASDGPSAADVYGDEDELRAAYGRSIEYSLESLISFVQHAGDDDLVLVLLGDHQPSPRVSGTDASSDVPISIVAHDPAVLDRISSWGWTPGLLPDPQAPVWRMDTFRDRFLDAFNGSPTTLATAEGR